MSGTRSEWRVGEHYGIHVYEGDRPIATFHREEDARDAVRAHNRQVVRADKTESASGSRSARDH